MSEDVLNKCPFCKSTNVSVYDSDFGDADGPLYWTVGCSDCEAHGPLVLMYGDAWWGEEQRKEVKKKRTDNARFHAVSMINRDRAIRLWNSVGNKE